jgi:hypothetical protein
MYGLAPGEPMPAGMYGWLIQFPNFSSSNWKGFPWTGGDPLDLGGGWRGSWSGSNVYASVSTFRQEADGSMGRRKHLFVGLHAIMIDDVGTKIDAKRALALPPSYYVETSPGNYQSWLFLAEPELDRERGEALIDSMVRDGLAAENDPGMRGVSRVGRPPFGWNDKPKCVEKLGKPWRVRLAGWHPERRYTVDEVIQRYRLRLEKPRPKYDGPPLSPAVLDARSREFAAILKGFHLLGMYRKAKRNGWHDVLCPWSDTHSDRPESGAALSEPSAANNWKGGFCCHHRCEQALEDVKWWLMRELKELCAGGAK